MAGPEHSGRLRVLGWLTAAGILAALALAGSGGAAPAAPPAHLQRSILLGGVPAAHGTASRAAACGTTPGLICSQVLVPLDRTGAVPGTISLHVEVLPALGAPRGALFLIAGGPGQGSAHVFGLDNDLAVATFRYMFPNYTLVAYDDRGTGDSGLLDCPATQAAVTADQQRAANTACGASIGQAASFYSTAQHAEDLEAVRQSLGFDKIALYGVSYGTKLAMAYALAHPTHVERMVLASVLPPEFPDPYSANVMRDIPAALTRFCSNGSCRSATSDYAGDVVAVSNALAAKPYQGKVLLPNGKTAVKRIDGLSVITTLVDADLNPGIAAEMPAAVHAARGGNIQPLLRLAYLRDQGSMTPSIDLSGALYAATVCRDGPFPWTPDTPIPDRPAILNAAVAALPSGTFGPFGNWAYRLGNADSCVGWPTPAGGAALGTGPLPNVPVLALNGDFDMRTPADGAQAVISRFPQGRLVVVQGVGHDPVDADQSGCALQAVRLWMSGGTPAPVCPRSAPLVAPVPALPGGNKTPKQPWSALATYSIASRTLADAEASALLATSSPVVPGVFGGRLTVGQGQVTLTRYAASPGVTLTGRLKVNGSKLPLRFEGTLTVAGASAANGILGVSGTSVRGSLGGRLVGK
ncbi:MAG TPA: alpha/beta fold hydrolase [Gaiellaceae bacterium]|nr:alpha/beta fold hydrolase [Gaiellaceae bacterium]